MEKYDEKNKNKTIFCVCVIAYLHILLYVYDVMQSRDYAPNLNFSMQSYLSTVTSSNQNGSYCVVIFSASLLKNLHSNPNFVSCT